MGDERVILYVEDDQDHADLVMRGLETAEPAPTVVHVLDGDAALAYLDRAGGDGDDSLPRCVLLDLRLPRRDGIEILATIRASEAHAHVPVVILSTSRSDQDVARAYAHHANSYLVKPTSFAQLTEAMHDLSRYWTTWNLPAR
jgi:CheY-like chemotaxis protein